ncbi:MAG: OmpH family outer membrane protein [Muribaculaceae bacterium]|nr:OmpH family outer membrane protein [Muribaculaceae bacterium]
MKKQLSVALMFVTALSIFNSSCNKNKDKAASKQQQISAIISKSDSLLPNYRYVDVDSVLSNYNLAKDYNEEMLRLQNSMESEVRKHENSLQSFASNMQNKMEKNLYLSDASLKADQQQLADMQNKAQRAVSALQNNFESAALMAQKTVNDSIEAFIREYNMTKGYDAIFFKAATLYVNPALDITNEVIEGLNARYNNK